jgi:hypothetical protein
VRSEMACPTRRPKPLSCILTTHSRTTAARSSDAFSARIPHEPAGIRLDTRPRDGVCADSLTVMRACFLSAYGPPCPLRSAE